MKVLVTLEETIEKEYEVEVDNEAYLQWLDGDNGDVDLLREYLRSGPDPYLEITGFNRFSVIDYEVIDVKEL